MSLTRPERQKVTSTQVEAIGWDEASRILHVEFKKRKDGTAHVYEYRDVEPSLVMGMLRAGTSVGREFAKIKAAYTGERVIYIHEDGSESDISRDF